MSDLIGGVAGFLTTVLILSYFLGDNALFRIGSYIFVGVSAGYLVSFAWWQVLWPRLFVPLMTAGPQERAELALPLLGVALILMKSSPHLARLGTPATAFLSGVAAAVVIWGALAGTLLPQVTATIGAFDGASLVAGNQGSFTEWLRGGVMALGTVSSLAYFHFGARPAPDGTLRRPAIVRALAVIGSIFIAATLGVLFAGVFSASLTALIDRMAFLIEFVTALGS